MLLEKNVISQIVAFAKDLDEARDTIATKKMNIFFMIHKINRPKLMLYHKKTAWDKYYYSFLWESKPSKTK